MIFLAKKRIEGFLKKTDQLSKIFFKNKIVRLINIINN